MERFKNAIIEWCKMLVIVVSLSPIAALSVIVFTVLAYLYTNLAVFIWNLLP